jgi:hypothetical protein
MKRYCLAKREERLKKLPAERKRKKDQQARAKNDLCLIEAECPKALVFRILKQKFTPAVKRDSATRKIFSDIIEAYFLVKELAEGRLFLTGSAYGIVASPDGTFPVVSRNVRDKAGFVEISEGLRLAMIAATFEQYLKPDTIIGRIN